MVRPWATYRSTRRNLVKDFRTEELLVRDPGKIFLGLSHRYRSFKLRWPNGVRFDVNRD